MSRYPCAYLEHLPERCLGRGMIMGNTSWFAPDGCSVWCAWDGGATEVWRVGGQDGVKFSGRIAGLECLPAGYPWESSCGYEVTDDWWILDPDGKRLLMLPPPWQSNVVPRVWKGQFLAFLHRGLPGPVILELLSP